MDGVEVTFGPLVETCKEFGIKRTMAFALARAGLVNTFKIRGRTYVHFDSIRMLPASIEARLLRGDTADRRKRNGVARRKSTKPKD